MKCPLTPYAILIMLLAVSPTASGQPSPVVLESPDPQPIGSFGFSVSGVPDADGDGVGDLFVGASLEAEGAGLAHLFSGATGALLRTLESPNPEGAGSFGFSVSGVPDVDGDGRGDLLVGALNEDGGAFNSGRVYLFSGDTGALLSTLESPNPEDFGRFGVAVSGVPDADGDGRGDLLVGVPNENVELPIEGRAYLYSGASGALLHTLESPMPVAFSSFGESVAGVPDADGDGRGDLLVGAFAEDRGPDDTVGAAYLFSGASGAPLHTLESPSPEAVGSFGISVSGVPDADGDGRGDLLIGAVGEDGGAFNAGRAYLFSGATGALSQTLESPNPEAGGIFGRMVSGVADADGDGSGDLLIGAHLEDGNAQDAGRAYLFSGDTGALLRTLESPNPEVSGFFGFAVSGVADADGDGLGDLLVGAEQEADGSASNAGRAYLFNGSMGTSVEESTRSYVFAFEAAYPNPARAATTVNVVLERALALQVEIFDALGRRVAQLHDGLLPSGHHTLRFRLGDLAPGAYYVRVRGGGDHKTQPLVILR